MAIANIKSNTLRRAMLVVAMPVLIIYAACYGAGACLIDLSQDFAGVWRRSDRP